MDNTFIGYSTLAPEKNRSWVLYDRELIKRDLLNHFHTRKGERVMRPTYGCAIWDWLFDQFTTELISRCQEEVERIVSIDSRIELRSVNINTFDHGIIVEPSIYYRPFDVVERMRIEFEIRQ
jgi:phage baseplate assembly protein W